MAETLLLVAILLIPLTSNTVAESRFVGGTLLVAVLFLFVGGVAAVHAVRARTFPTNPAGVAGLALAPAMVLSFAVSPSGSGGILVLFVVAAAGASLAIGTLGADPLRRLVAIPLLVTAALQSILVIAQTLTDRAIGLMLIDPEAELHFIDGLLRSQGTMHHVYEPAALALLAAGVAVLTVPSASRLHWLWVIGAGLAGTTIGLTHSRSALVGLVLMTVFGVAFGRRHPGVVAVGGAFLIGFAVTAALTASAWSLRTDHSTTGDLDDVTLGRVTLAKQAVEMAADHPVVGVGPGLYLDTMRSDYGLDDRYPFIVHNVSLAVAAENGVLVAVVASVLVGWAIVRIVWSRSPVGVLALSIVGFLLFDALHYDRPVGLLMTGIWLGVLSASLSAQTSRDSRSS